MTYTLSITDAQVFTAIRAWVIDALGAGIEVVQELNNRVPSPRNGFITMSRVTAKQLGTSEVTYSDGHPSTPSTVSITQGVDYAIQLDCYGNDSATWSTIIASAWDTLQACDFLKTYGVMPLYVGDPRHLAFIEGEKQYQHRWTIDIHLQYNPAVTTTQQFADVVTATIINVDVVYPPSA